MMRIRNKKGLCGLRQAAIVGILLVTAVVANAQGGVSLSVLPTDVSVGLGETFDVELTVPAAGSPFNAYDAVVGFDSEVLTFVPQLPSQQEGPLMTGACGHTFHYFAIDPDGDRLLINHSLLCAGISLTGPGVVYRLRFQAGQQNVMTHIRLLEGTRFYNGGIEVLPVITTDTTVRIGEGTDVPPAEDGQRFALRAAPNPFNPQTTIFFVVPQEGWARLDVHDLSGQRVRTLWEGILAAGPQQVQWDGRNAAGLPAGSGVYLVRLETAGSNEVRSIALVK